MTKYDALCILIAIVGWGLLVWKTDAILAWKEKQ